MKKNLWVILMIYSAAAAFGADYGLVLGTEGKYTGAMNPEGFSLNATAFPWFSAVLTENINLYVSGKMTLDYEATGEAPASYFFEVERTELNLRSAAGLHLSLGRQRFQDTAGLIASGLFDGAAGSVNLGFCRLSLGAYYTGLLYKETAKIIMTPDDFERYKKPLDAPGLEGYFASRRALLALTGEFPDVTSRISLSAQVLAQIDLNDGSDTLHTEYLELGFTAEPVDSLYFNLGAIGELAQGPGAVQRSAAVLAGTDWEVPGVLPDLFSAELLWTSGRTGVEVCAFTPLSGRNGGQVFDGGLGALMRAGLSYQVRPAPEFSVEGGGAYFIRTDLETLEDPDLDGASESRSLGGELYGFAAWGPDSVFRMSAGGGVFFPRWGNAYRDEAPVRWNVKIGLILSL
jgi:hypothetical protein